MSLKDQLNKDLDIFFNSEELADNATLNGVKMHVFFEKKEDVVFDTGLESDVSAGTPCIMCKSIDVKDANYNDEVIVNNIIYYIIDIDPPLSGVVKIYLSEDKR